VRRATTALAALALAIFPASAPAAPPVVGGLTFNDAPPLSQGSWWDALDTGGTVFYRVHAPGGAAPKATVTLDLGALDPSDTGGSSLDVKVYDSLRRPVAEGQSVGPGDPTTHVKSVTATAPRAAAVEGDWYVSAKVNDFLPDGTPPVQLPLGVSVALASKDAGAAPRPQAAKARSRGGGGASWALFATLCVAGAAVGVLGGAALRRR
jgi:hypothetical protein